ncbi:hypothetical protein ACFLXW_00525 [Candidatus Dependentiae bacterium]
MNLINKKSILALLIFSVSLSVHVPLVGAQKNTSRSPSMRAKAAPVVEPTQKELEELQLLLKEKIGEAIELGNEIQAQQKAGLPAVIIDTTIGNFLNVLRVIVAYFVIFFNLYGLAFALPALFTVSRSLTKDVKEGTPEAALKQTIAPEQVLPYITSGTLSPNIFNISFAYTERQEQALAELKKPGALTAIQKGLRGTLFMLDRIGTYAKVPLKLSATITVLAFITLTSAISAILYIPGTIFTRLFNALTFLREKVAIEPSVPEIDPIGS